MDADIAEEEIFVADVGESRLLHRGFELLPVHESLRALGQVGVGLGFAEDRSEFGQEGVADHTARGSYEAVSRLSHVERNEAAPGLKDAVQLAVGLINVGHVSDSPTDANPVEDIGLYGKEAGISETDITRDVLLLGLLEHGEAEVDAENLAVVADCFAEGDHEVAGAAADVENAAAFVELELPDGEGSPSMMESERHQGVEEIVSRRDLGEHALHGCSLLSTLSLPNGLVAQRVPRL